MSTDIAVTKSKKLSRTDVFFLALSAASLLLVLAVWLGSQSPPKSSFSRPASRQTWSETLQFAQRLNYGSKGSFLSVGSLGSIASIGMLAHNAFVHMWTQDCCTARHSDSAAGSTGSILSIGSAGSVLSIASVGGVGTLFAILGAWSFGGFNLVCGRSWPYGLGQLRRKRRTRTKDR